MVQSNSTAAFGSADDEGYMLTCLKSLWDIISKSFGYDLLCLEIDMLMVLQLVGSALLYYPIDPVHIAEDLGVEAVAFGTADSP